jgi:hypothetical protein
MAMATAAVLRRRVPPAPVSKTTPTCLICFDPLAVLSQAGGRLLRSSSKSERFYLDCEHPFCQPCLSQYAAT